MPEFLLLRWHGVFLRTRHYLFDAMLDSMYRELVNDELWEILEPLLPPEPSKANGGRPRIPARAVLHGIVYVLRTGMPWKSLPKELGCGSGVTCWRRLRDWRKARL